MNIDNLTLGQIKEIKKLVSDEQSGKKQLHDAWIGEYVIVRSYSEGVNAGYLEAADDSGVVLRDARRLWSHAPKDKSMSWFEGVALSGLSSSSKISSPVNKIIVDRYTIVECSKDAEKSITEALSNAQN